MSVSLGSRWATFIRERFPLSTHLPMIALFTAMHAVLAPSADLVRTAVLGGILLLFFFRMRLFDEIKDADTDFVLHPERPVPRGLLTVKQIKHAIALCYVLEILLCLAFPRLLPFLWIAQGYSLLMYREFFIGGWLRPHLTTYAVTHTVVVVFLSLFSFCMAGGILPWELPLRAFGVALGCWGVFNVFEFGRKTFAAAEERPGVASYSKVWTRGGAFVLNLSQVLISLFALGWAVPFAPLQWGIAAGITALFAGCGAAYLVRNTARAAKIYRGVSGLSIMLVLGLGVLHALY